MGGGGGRGFKRRKEWFRKEEGGGLLKSGKIWKEGKKSGKKEGSLEEGGGWVGGEGVRKRRMGEKGVEKKEWGGRRGKKGGEYLHGGGESRMSHEGL